MSDFLKASEIGTGGAMTLPREYYTSEAFFERELERIFYRRWVCVGREDQVPDAGDYFLRDLGAENLIVTRDADGPVRAFYNVCRHRGSRLCSEARGRFSGAIRCPYHLWTYALDGRLRAAPRMEELQGFRKEDYPLHSAAVAPWEGFIWVSLAEEPVPFEVSHAPVVGRFSRFHLPALRAARRVEYDVRANWKLLFENYSECYHCPAIHRALVKLSPADSGRNDLTEGAFLGGYMDLVDGCESLTASGKPCAVPVGDLPAEDLRRVYYYTLFPNVLLSLHPDYVMVHTLRPQSPERTVIVCEWLFHPTASARPGFAPDDAVTFWDRVNREDWRACEESQLGIASRAYRPGPYSPRESLSAEFDREVLRALDEPGL